MTTLPSPQDLRAMHISGGGNLTWEQIGAIYGRKGQAIRSKVRRSIPTPKPFIVQRPKSNEPLDWQRWQDTLSTLRHNTQFVTVSHLSDIHFGDHDESALNMAYELVRRKQPHIIVVGSDAADFGVLSSFTPNPDEHEAVDDVLDHFKRYWWAHIDKLRQVAPNAALVHIHGNHEQRIYRFMAENAPKLRLTVEQAWIEALTYQGRVMWIGRTEEVEIGNLLVKHGDRTNEHVAKSLLEDVSYQMSVMAGHVHRLTSYERAGRKYSIKAVTGGCLQNLVPAYKRGKSKGRPQQQGTCFAVTDLRGTGTWFDNIEFVRSGKHLVAVTDNEWLQMPAKLAA